MPEKKRPWRVCYQWGMGGSVGGSIEVWGYYANEKRAVASVMKPSHRLYGVYEEWLEHWSGTAWVRWPERIQEYPQTGGGKP